ncbi:hypothetical protein HAU32_04935 [Weissella confusa]|uniref:Uncharacterized protein n=1 Tax=Weissella fermenti TaxID=2987699 RepID=A0ABT6D2U1_9LACO|nr:MULTISPECIES: hypothetical protein [Weissella]MBJ7688322.1 hypothetical protein [Weissella confusa]MCW0927370.1 hypothetical protein [Weissella sp. LMG 11983]MDF9299815.1 hypothetical protein [Weissella sp. BK2]
MKKLKFSILGLVSLIIAVPIYLFGASYAMSWFSPDDRPQNPVRQSERVSASLASIQSFNDKLIAAGISPVEPASYIEAMPNTDNQTSSPTTARTSQFVRAESNEESSLAQSEDSTPVFESTSTPSNIISAASSSQPTISSGAAQEPSLSSSELSSTSTSSTDSVTTTTSTSSSDSSEVSSSLSSVTTSESSNTEDSSGTANDLTSSEVTPDTGNISIDSTPDTDISVVKNS